MKCFAFSEILLGYLRFLFHLEFPYFFNTYCTFWQNSILFQGLENQFWNSILFQYRVGTLPFLIYCDVVFLSPTQYSFEIFKRFPEFRAVYFLAGCVVGVRRHLTKNKCHTLLETEMNIFSRSNLHHHWTIKSSASSYQEAHIHAQSI